MCSLSEGEGVGLLLGVGLLGVGLLGVGITRSDCITLMNDITCMTFTTWGHFDAEVACLMAKDSLRDEKLDIAINQVYQVVGHNTHKFHHHNLWHKQLCFVCLMFFKH